MHGVPAADRRTTQYPFKVPRSARVFARMTVMGRRGRDADVDSAHGTPPRRVSKPNSKMQQFRVGGGVGGKTPES